MLGDDLRRGLRKPNHALLDVRHVIETWPEDAPLWHLPEWQADFDDIMGQVVRYRDRTLISTGETMLRRVCPKRGVDRTLFDAGAAA